MKLVKELPRRKDKRGYNIKYGLFICTCGTLLDRPMTNGKKQKHCMKCGNKQIAIKNRANQTKHGGKYTRLYRIWRGMKGRCLNKTNKDYVNYGARGISVCDEWANDFASFMNWAYSSGYRENLSIDRINNNGNYEPSNCRWATPSEQVRNRRDNVFDCDKAKEVYAFFKKYGIRKTKKEFSDINRSSIHNVCYGDIWSDCKE